MKVIFLDDVQNLAKAGEVKEVADGYARNYLIPKKMAAVLHPKAANAIHALLKARNARITNEEDAMSEIAKNINGKSISISARVGKEGRLYGAVTASNIVEEIEQVFKVFIDKRKVELESPIQQVGNYEVPLKLGKDITPKVTVCVTAEQDIKHE